ncbi:unnamed protein product [Linum tenue]|uniref:Uncharacterized protein n=1 Tax=Linum tenue TaxID=586396 RepID=A0AAV0MP04_9ROSI|nr:unnamed protein product [Linum tenue]
MDNHQPPPSSSSSTADSSTGNSSRDQYLKSLNKLPHKISKPTIPKKPFDQPPNNSDNSDNNFNPPLPPPPRRCPLPPPNRRKARTSRRSTTSTRAISATSSRSSPDPLLTSASLLRRPFTHPSPSALACSGFALHRSFTSPIAPLQSSTTLPRRNYGSKALISRVEITAVMDVVFSSVAAVAVAAPQSAETPAGWQTMGNEKKKAMVHEEVKRMNKLPANSSYTPLQSSTNLPPLLATFVLALPHKA